MKHRQYSRLQCLTIINTFKLLKKQTNFQQNARAYL